MREILFRGKRKDNGKWITDSETYIFDGDGIWLSDKNCDVVNVIPETVGQYTGLEANGVMIFEGDILQYDYLIDNHDPHFGFDLVSFKDQAFFIGDQLLHNISKMKLTILGNFHDHPELLET